MTATYPPPNAEPPPEAGDGSSSLDRSDAEELPAPPAKAPGAVRKAFARVPGWIGPVAVGGLALTSCIYVRSVDPTTTPSPFYPQCTFKLITGLDCPGCGLTRAMHELMNGHPGLAADHNIFILLIFPLAAYMYVRWLLRKTIGYELPSVSVPAKVSWMLAPLVISFWILRNIAWGPFHWFNAGLS